MPVETCATCGLRSDDAAGHVCNPRPSLEDMFAMAVIVGFVVRQEAVLYDHEEKAAYAYAIADACMAERRRRREREGA